MSKIKTIKTKLFGAVGENLENILEKVKEQTNQLNRNSKILLVFLIYAMILYPLVNVFDNINEEKELVEGDLHGMSEDLRVARAELNQWGSVKENLAQYKDNYSDYDPNLTMLLLLINTKESLDELNLHYLKPRPMEYTVINESYTETPVALNIIGPFEEFVRFFKDLRSLYPSPIVRNLEMKAQEGNILQAELDLVVLARNPLPADDVKSAKEIMEIQELEENPFGIFVDFEQLEKEEKGKADGNNDLPSIDVPDITPGDEEKTEVDEGDYHWPLAVEGEVTSPFGMREDPFNPGKKQMHYGIDVAAPSGTPVLTVNDGIVAYTGQAGTWGNAIVVQHSEDEISFYSHLQDIEVSSGQQVKRGQQIGLSGSTGSSTGPHLHFGYAINDQFVDPEPYMGTP